MSPRHHGAVAHSHRPLLLLVLERATGDHAGHLQLPTAYAGARWVFPNLPNLSGCRRCDNPQTAADLEGWSCRRVHADGENSWIAFLHWRSIRAARSHYRDWFNREYHFAETSWAPGGTFCGTRMTGRAGGRGALYRTVRFYTAGGTQPWSVSVSSDTASKRETTVESVAPYRAPYEFRGVER